MSHHDAPNHPNLRRFVAVGLVVILAVVAAISMPVPPFGWYSEDRIATADDCYYSFIESEMVLSVPGQADQVQGLLVKTNGHWMLVLESGLTVKLRPRLLVLEMDEGGPQFISRHRRYFGIKWIDWVVRKFI